jgi:hypothetical protein
VRVPFPKVVVTSAIIPSSPVERFELFPVLSRIAKKMSVRSSVALDRNLHDTENSSSYMLSEEQTSDLTPTGRLQLPLQLLKD